MKKYVHSPLSISNKDEFVISRILKIISYSAMGMREVDGRLALSCFFNNFLFCLNLFHLEQGCPTPGPRAACGPALQ